MIWPFSSALFGPPLPKKFVPPLRRNPPFEWVKDNGAIQLYSEDDLLLRAKKITYYLGFRGYVSDYVLSLYEVLKLYQELDEKEQTDDIPTPSEANNISS
jgi:hypothetical protein